MFACNRLCKDQQGIYSNCVSLVQGKEMESKEFQNFNMHRQQVTTGYYCRLKMAIVCTVVRD